MLVISEPLTKLISNIIITNPACKGGNGSAFITSSGGGTPYQYRKDTGAYVFTSTFTNLAPRAYNFNIKDNNGCEIYFSASVIDPPALQLTLQKNNITCNGLNNGKVTLSVSGGKTPYQFKVGAGTYTSNPLFTNLAPGLSIFTVKDSNNCTKTDSAILSQPAAFTKSMNFNNAKCLGSNDGTASISVAGATPPYQYSWNTTPVQTGASATGLHPGYAKVTVSDSNACVTKDSVLISYKPIYNGEEICVVTVDTITGKNIVVWNKTAGVGIAAYKIYASTSATGTFSLIGNQVYNNFSTFTDVTSPILPFSYYYHLKALDSCNNESAASPVHRTMHASTNAVAGGMIAVNWNSYSGNSNGVSQNVWRSVNGAAFVNLSTVALSATSYIDSTPPSGLKRYLIELVLGINCTPSLNKKAEYIHVYSNIVNAGATGLAAINVTENFEVYPNPTTGIINVSAIQPGLYIRSIEVINMLGATVKEQVLDGLNQQAAVDLDGMADGVYHVFIITDKGARYPAKIILNRGR